jgi:hypothetical protein
MAKIFSKKLLLLFSAIAFIAYGMIWACGGGDWEYADRQSTNFSVLKSNKSTKYYTDIIKECGYFKSYLAQNK